MNGQQSQIYDIYGVCYRPFWQTPIFYWLVALVIVLVLTTVVAILIKKRRARKLKKSAWQIALHDLKLLEHYEVINEKSAQAFYLKLTAIMKQYLQNRYGYQVIGKTDNELLALLPTTNFPKELIPGLEALFRGSVEIKFARGAALTTQVKQDLTHAVLVVKTTMPRDRN